MAASAALMPVEEYLALTSKPYCEYRDGVLRQKAMPTYKHGKMELRLGNLINRLDCGFEATPEQTVRLGERKYLVPDVAVQRTAELQQPYPTKPIHLCVEVLSPEDRFSETIAKCEEYHAWGVPTCWVIDPEEKQAWEYRAGGRPHQIPSDGRIATDEISLSLADVFAGF
jgi:Uma2 family endonuclease